MEKFSNLKNNTRRIFEKDETINDLDDQIVDRSIDGDNPSKLFSKLFESREMAHIYHLQVNGESGSHAKHVSLNEYYDNILEFIDELIESYQGQYGIVEDYDIINTKETRSKDTLSYFEELSEFVKTERKSISDEDTHLHSIIDSILVLIYRTIYKLKFTK